MTQIKVKLTSISDVQKFVNAVSRFSGGVDLQSGRYVVDAKSIMGIFSLDLTKKITVEAHTEDAEAFAKSLHLTWFNCKTKRRALIGINNFQVFN